YGAVQKPVISQWHPTDWPVFYRLHLGMGHGCDLPPNRPRYLRTTGSPGGPTLGCCNVDHLPDCGPLCAAGWTRHGRLGHDGHADRPWLVDVRGDGRASVGLVGVVAHHDFGPAWRRARFYCLTESDLIAD